MSCLLSREQRSIGGEREVDTGERHQVGLEFVQIDVEGAAEPEGRCDRGHDLSDQPIQIREAGLGDPQALLADVVNGLVVHLWERIAYVKRPVSDEQQANGYGMDNRP